MRSALALALLVMLASALHAEPFTDGAPALGLGLDAGQVCWADFNSDGWTDIVSAGGVWRNEGGKRFARYAEGIGPCVAADYDNDGFVDLFCWSSLQVFHNRSGASFEAIPMPEHPVTSSRGACWGDFNNDGFVDLYIGGFEDWDRQITYPNLILINEGGKSFRLAWSEERYRSRGVTACDFDEDGDLDVYVSDYRLQPNMLWVNDGNGQFRDAASEYNAIATSEGFGGGHSIGAAWGDFNNDGHTDLFAGNFAHVDSRGDQPKSRFLRNQGPDHGYVFEDLGTCGVWYQESYASPAAGDYDNDGDVDLIFTTVYGVASFGRPNFPVLYRNDGAFSFADATADAGVGELPPTYQAAWADFDNDGDLDLTCGGKLFVNPGNGNHSVRLRLYGDGARVNWSAIGAQARITLPGPDGTVQTLTRQVEAGTGEGNQNDLVLHFGVGAYNGPVDVEVRWPNGERETVKDVALDCLTAVRYGEQ